MKFGHNKEEILTYEMASRLFSYTPEGFLVWKNPVNKTKKPGQVVGGRRKDGRQQVMLFINGKSYLFLIYRIIWLLHHKTWPSKTVDHINGDCTDDRIENLRDVAQQLNNENRYDALITNKTGILGVCFDNTRGKYRATIVNKGKQEHLGFYETKEEAEAAYLKRKKQVHVSQKRKETK